MKRRILLLALGLAGGILALEGLLRIPSGLFWGAPMAADPHAIRILALGESTTQGGFMREENYPGMLELKLREACPGKSIEVWNAGLAGALSSDIRRDLPLWIEKTRPQIATIMMGINDIQGTGGPIAVVGRSRWRVVRLAHWFVASLKKRAEPSPEIAQAKRLGELGRWDYFRLVTQALQNQNRREELEALHREVLRVSPGSLPAALDLGTLLRGKGALEEALEWHKKARPRGSYDPWVEWEILVDLNLLESSSHTVMEAADALIQRGRGLPMPVVTNLLDFLERKHDKPRAIALLQEASKREAGRMILEWRKLGLKAGNFEDARRASLAPYPESLQQNYRAIVAELEESGAKVLPLTYPRQPAQPLEAFLHEPVLSLELAFESLIQKEGYSGVFYDSFGGNFGHFTNLGNEFLATKLAGELLAREPLKSACK